VLDTGGAPGAGEAVGSGAGGSGAVGSGAVGSGADGSGSGADGSGAVGSVVALASLVALWSAGLLFRESHPMRANLPGEPGLAGLSPRADVLPELARLPWTS
jgi:hypothetical protein